jgi:hypothetical protein
MKLCIAAIALLGACSADDDGSADVDRPSEACVEHAPNAFRTRFEGAGFAHFEASRIQVVTTIGLVDPSNITCRAASRTTIINGAFIARADNRRDDAVYPLLGAYIDVDDDGACTAAVDMVWTQTSIAPPPDLEDTFTVSPELFGLQAEAEGCALVR